MQEFKKGWSEMDEELKSRWISALRSGTYKQGTSFLRKKNGKYCCLGVLANLCEEEWHLDTHYYDVYSVLGSCSIYGETVGLTQNQIEQLSGMNDDGLNFNQIANWIERNV